ncbi:hypothetical protein FPV67DRAFT_1372166, partial [Lyophyllum atratum]
SPTMAPHTSTELRKRMVYWKDELQLSTAEIAKLASCSERTVREVLRLHREHGMVHNPFAQPRGRRRSLETADMNFILSILDANPALYLDEIQSRLSDDRNTD